MTQQTKRGLSDTIESRVYREVLSYGSTGVEYSDVCAALSDVHREHVLDLLSTMRRNGLMYLSGTKWYVVKTREAVEATRRENNRVLQASMKASDTKIANARSTLVELADRYPEVSGILRAAANALPPLKIKERARIEEASKRCD